MRMKHCAITTTHLTLYYSTAHKEVGEVRGTEQRGIGGG